MSRGWFLKYRITKADGSECDQNADYFVLRLDKDPAARKAALAYAEATPDGELARDLKLRVLAYKHPGLGDAPGVMGDERAYR